MHFRCNLGLSISGFVLSYNPQRVNLTSNVFVRVGFGGKWNEMEVALSGRGVAAFKDLQLPEAESKEFSQQAYTLMVYVKEGVGRVLFENDFHYASMTLSTAWLNEILIMSQVTIGGGGGGGACGKRYKTAADAKWRKPRLKSWRVKNMHVNACHNRWRNFVMTQYFFQHFSKVVCSQNSP